MGRPGYGDATSSCLSLKLCEKHLLGCIVSCHRVNTNCFVTTFVAFNVTGPRVALARFAEGTSFPHPDIKSAISSMLCRQVVDTISWGIHFSTPIEVFQSSRRMTLRKALFHPSDNPAAVATANRDKKISRIVHKRQEECSAPLRLISCLQRLPVNTRLHQREHHFSQATTN